MTRGVVIYGVNTSSVDYIQLAVMAAGFVKKNMPGVQIHLITDEGSKAYHDAKGRWDIDKFFDSFQFIETVETTNERVFRDTRYYQFKAPFKNESRARIYDLTPFDETLLIDSDFLICSDVLNCVWGSNEDVMINKKASSLLHTPLVGPEFRLNPFGIRMYWATVIYFRKGEKARQLFQLVEHIKDNWDFYQLTYDFPGSLYRNDYAFSIAIHILNGFTESDDFVKPLPEPQLLTALDTDQFYRIRSHNDLSFFANDHRENWKFYVSRLKSLNVHCMNKISLMNNMEEIMEVLS